MVGRPLVPGLLQSWPSVGVTLKKPVSQDSAISWTSDFKVALDPGVFVTEFLRFEAVPLGVDYLRTGIMFCNF